jgi:quercetin dioxygenase-like cupin family protein
MTAPKATWHRWEELPSERVNDMMSRQLITGSGLMLAHVRFKEGAVVPTHSHHNEQMTYVLEGAMRFFIGEGAGEEFMVRAGEVVVIPSNVPHRAEVLEDTLEMDVFTPPRRDWLEGTDEYLRRG